MIHSPYGNYFIQTVMEVSEAKSREPIVKEIIKNIFQICNEKFSYNCIIKLLEYGTKNEKKKVLLKLMNPEKLVNIKRNKYFVAVISKLSECMSRNFLNHFIEVFNNFQKLELINNILISKLENFEKDKKRRSVDEI